jgi:hypothetical protein
MISSGPGIRSGMCDELKMRSSDAQLEPCAPGIASEVKGTMTAS